MPKEWKALRMLADDARARGMLELAIVYQQAAIQIGTEFLSAKMQELHLNLEKR